MTADERDVAGIAGRLSVAEHAMLAALGDGEVVCPIADYARDAALSVEDARSAVRRLKSKGFAMHGLLRDLDDGRPKGSGYWLTASGMALRQHLMENPNVQR